MAVGIHKSRALSRAIRKFLFFSVLSIFLARNNHLNSVVSNTLVRVFKNCMKNFTFCSI